MPRIEINGQRYEIQITTTIPPQQVPPAGVQPDVLERMRADARVRGEMVPDQLVTQIIFECIAPIDNGSEVTLHRAADNLGLFSTPPMPRPTQMMVRRHDSSTSTYIGTFLDA